jgi:hypothetical protein
MARLTRATIIALGIWSLSATIASPIVGADLRSGAIFLNFDDVEAPCLFTETTALHDLYLDQGVRFRGERRLDGGGIVNECGNWGVSGHSSPNFVGFNVNGAYMDGGLALPPGKIWFTTPVGQVTVNVASGGGVPGTARMVAYDAAHHKLAADEVVLSSQMQPLEVVAAGIQQVIIDATVDSWVLDDLEAI